MTPHRVDSIFLWCDTVTDVINFVFLCSVFIQLFIVFNEHALS
jgi:hypothetical protein